MARKKREEMMTEEIIEKKVQKLTSWKQLEEVKKEGEIQLEFPDTIMEITLRGVSPEEVEEIEEKYDKLRPAKPSYYDRELKEWVEIDEEVYKELTSPELKKKYEDWERQSKEIRKNYLAELVLLFMVEKPEGTLEEQIQRVRNTLLLGHFYQIIEEGYRLSGFRTDKQIEKAKNS